MKAKPKKPLLIAVAFDLWCPDCRSPLNLNGFSECAGFDGSRKADTFTCDTCGCVVDTRNETINAAFKLTRVKK